MSKRFLFLSGMMAAAPAFGQVASPEVQLANLQEDVRGLSQRIADLSLRLDQIEAENGRLAEKLKSTGHDGVTAAEMTEAVAAAKDDTLRVVSAQLEKLARETNAAIDSISKNQVAHPAAAATGGFSDDFPKEGEKYTVQKGETIALIAKRTGAKVSDIINANKIADPSRIFVGQTLFIPGGK